jgi:hypothetical protein
MAFRSVAFPLLSGGALLFGYAAFAWLRAKPRALKPAPEPRSPRAEHEPCVVLEPLAEHLEHLSDRLNTDASSDEGMDDEEPQSARATHIRALFLARLTEALSPYDQQFALAQASQ